MKVLFGVFDWGLGHATRDLPLIEALLKKKHTVHIISTGRALALLKQHFGERVTYYDVPSITNPYTKHRFFTVGFIFYTPRMIKHLLAARKHTKAIITREHYDRVISDCRYDVYDTPKNSYLINHQVRFKSFKGAERVGEAWLAKQQRRYKYVIVPDYQNNDLTGNLSHHLRSLESHRVKYIGILSFIKKLPVKKDVDYFISISGPEPQRTILEQHLLPQLKNLQGTIVVTLGKPEHQKTTTKGRITIHNFLNRTQQEQMMNRAKFVITRPGYTTVMELYELGIKNALFIPTPGQTEQEYLADLYTARGEFHHNTQYKLNLTKDIELARHCTGFKQQWKTKTSVQKFLKIIFP